MTYTNMIRTQVYLTKPIYQGIKILAQRENKPTAEVIRELLNKGLQKESKKNTAYGLLSLAEKATESGVRDFSTNIDKYLYE